MDLVELFGWYGAAAVVGAYALVSFSIIDASGLLFQLLNVSGAAGILAVSLRKKVYQSVVLQIVWASIGFVALAQIIF